MKTLHLSIIIIFIIGSIVGGGIAYAQYGCYSDCHPETLQQALEKAKTSFQNTTTILSPLKQFKSGTLAQDIKCGQGFQLIIKLEDGSPACVKPDTAIVLVE
ncbi:MAG: hypothetical protein ACREA3_03600, partial [Nitrosotalea sp.]